MDRPAFFRCDEPGSFGLKTFQERLPGILTRLMDDWRAVPKPADILQCLEAIAADLNSDVVVAPTRLAPMIEMVKWSHLPFLYAEIYFYDRILEAFGNDSSVDPFQFQKQEAKRACSFQTKALLETKDLPTSLESRFLSAFYGNKTDLSLHSLKEATIATSGNRDLILVNDLPAIEAHLKSLSKGSQIDIIVDNYYFELLNDVLLAKLLVEEGFKVVIHCKKFPIFVSDATEPNVHEVLELVGVKNIGVMAHEYWNTQWEWFEKFPLDLKTHFEKSSLSIVKGDANYRKLVGERHYSVDKSFQECVAYFPGAAVCALRGLKCELVVGVSLDCAAKQQAMHPAWKVDGSRGVIQLAIR